MGCGHCEEKRHAHGHENGHGHGQEEESCCCSHHGEEEGCCCSLHEEETGKGFWLRLILGAGLMALGLIFPAGQEIRLLLFLSALLAAGYPVFLKAGKNLLKGRMLDEMFLMSVSAAGAFLIGEYVEGVAVMLLFTVGEYLQGRAVEKSRKSIADMMDLRPEKARIQAGDAWAEISPEDVKAGEMLLVYPGERIPLDGVIVDGESALDTASLTGESALRQVKMGDEVISGCVNQTGTLKIRVERTCRESTVSRILDMAENAARRKSRLDLALHRFARAYTPGVVIAALLLAILPPVCLGGDWREWVHTALTFLVISCPCALVISVPLTYFGGIGACSRRGILVKGAHYLEMLARAETVVLDKTGTLTEGKFSVLKLCPRNIGEKELLALAASAESCSHHPIAQSLLACCPEEERMPCQRAVEMPGLGIEAQVGGRQIAVGNAALMKKIGVAAENLEGRPAAVHVAENGEYRGWILVGDRVKTGAKAALDALRALGVRQFVMLTGDSGENAGAVGAQVGISRIHAGLLPHEKVEKLEMLLKEKSEKGALIFVGDGVNDAPVLSRADVGVAMGALGSDAAIEAADVVLMEDHPARLADAVKIAGKTRRIVWQNMVFALAVKALVMGLGIFHLAPLWLAVLADVGVCLLAIANALRNR